MEARELAGRSNTGAVVSSPCGIGASRIEGYSPFASTPRCAMIWSRNIKRRSWRYSSGQTANIATRTFRRAPAKRGFALTSAPSAPAASRTSSTMSARTAAAALSRARSDQPRSGGPGYRLPSDRLRTNGCIYPTASRTLPRIPPGSGIFRRTSAKDLYVVISGWSERPYPESGEFRARSLRSRPEMTCV